jgi:hypothetical protein
MEGNETAKERSGNAEGGGKKSADRGRSDDFVSVWLSPRLRNKGWTRKERRLCGFRHRLDLRAHVKHAVYHSGIIQSYKMLEAECLNSRSIYTELACYPPYTSQSTRMLDTYRACDA